MGKNSEATPLKVANLLAKRLGGKDKEPIATEKMAINMVLEYWEIVEKGCRLQSFTDYVVREILRAKKEDDALFVALQGPYPTPPDGWEV